MRFTFIAAERAEHTVTILCRCLCVTRSGFYAWHGRTESAHARDDRRLKVLVQASFHQSQHRYGSPRIHEDLIEQQEHGSRKRVIRLMQEEGVDAMENCPEHSFPPRPHPSSSSAPQERTTTSDHLNETVH